MNYNERRKLIPPRAEESVYLTNGPGGGPVVPAAGEILSVLKNGQDVVDFIVIGNGVDNYSTLKAAGIFERFTPINISASVGRDFDNVNNNISHVYTRSADAWQAVFKTYKPPTATLSFQTVVETGTAINVTPTNYLEVGDTALDVTFQASYGSGTERVRLGQIYETTAGTAFDATTVSKTQIGIDESASDPNNISAFTRQLTNVSHLKGVYNSSTGAYRRSFRSEITDARPSPYTNYTALSGVKYLNWVYPMYAGLVDDDLQDLFDNNLASLKSVIRATGKLTGGAGLQQKSTVSLNVTTTTPKRAFICYPQIYGALSEIRYNPETISINYATATDVWNDTPGTTGATSRVISLDEAASSPKWSGVNYLLYFTYAKSVNKVSSGAANFALDLKF